MAKLCSHYTLSSFIDLQNLLGVEKESNSDYAIITLSRNFIIRYKLLDGLKVNSWSSTERFTSQVIYDETTQKYSAVFKEKYIKVWPEGEIELDKVKKIKFSQPLHSILTLDGFSPVVLLKNGNTASLEYAIDNRKNLPCREILKSGETLLKAQLINVNSKMYLYSLNKIDNVYNYIVVPLEKKDFLGEEDKIKRIKLKQDLQSLVEHVVVKTKENAYLLTLWSDGKLYNHCLISSFVSSSGDLLDTITVLNTKQHVAMAPLDGTTIAMYGADFSEKGAMLCVYNLHFKLILAKKIFKSYSNNAKLWNIGGKLFLAHNQNLSVIPFRLAPDKLTMMIGSSQNLKDNYWDEKGDVIVNKNNKPMVLKYNSFNPAETTMDQSTNFIFKQITALKNENFSNSLILEIIIPKLIETKDISSILWCLDNFRDLPEKLLVELLSFSLQSSDSGEFLENGDIYKHPSEIQSEILNKILSNSFTDIYLLKYLKTSLSFKEIFKLLQILTERICRFNASELDIIKLYQWINLLLDSHYQEYILNQDLPLIRQFQILDAILNQHFQILKSLKSLRPLLVKIMKGKPEEKPPRDFNRYYSIENVKLF